LARCWGSEFKTLSEALEEANRLPFGLAGYAFTQSLKNSHKISQELQVGMLWINQQALAWPEMPFGGIKESGYGSEGGYEAVEAYLNTKSVSIFAG
jgi:succinate-semialdehyde dehydrogenase/glutarate-semialdehyde dehydrogenase